MCKLALWLEGHTKGKPLSFLDHRIRNGNSLIGAFSYDQIKNGIPDDAFNPVTGDDKEVAKYFKKRNKEEKKGKFEFFGPQMGVATEKEIQYLSNNFSQFDNLNIDSAEDYHKAEEEFAKLKDSPQWQREWNLANIWTYAFFAPLVDFNDRTVPTHEELNKFLTPHQSKNGQLVGKADAASLKNKFFHWFLEFPEVFAKGGFDCILGNPPWEKTTILEREFFINFPKIGEEKRSDLRKIKIKQLKSTNPSLYNSWEEKVKEAESDVKFMRKSKRFELSAVGELNLYPLFTEASLKLINKHGSCGLIIKTGMMLSPTWATFSAYLVKQKLISSVFDFRNWHGWFPGVGYHERFSLLTLSSNNEEKNIKLGYYLDEIDEIHNSEKIFTIDAQDILKINPLTKTVPSFENLRDKEIILNVYNKFPTLNSELSGWEMKYTVGLHMSSEANELHDAEELIELGFQFDNYQRFSKQDIVYIPLYEGKLFHQYDYRFASFENIPREKRFGVKAPTVNPDAFTKNNPEYHIQPRYWVNSNYYQSDCENRLNGSWTITFRDTTNVISNFRTCIACICDNVAYNYKAPNLVLENRSVEDNFLFLSMFNSFAFDYVVRQKFFGANLIKSILEQIAAPSKNHISNFKNFIIPRVLEISYTSSILSNVAALIGYDGSPFIWNEERRFIIKCELDALFFRIYNIENSDIEYILDSFRILREREEKECGEYHTKRVILEIFNEMLECERTGKQYQTRLDPPPADPRVAHGYKEKEKVVKELEEIDVQTLRDFVILYSASKAQDPLRTYIVKVICIAQICKSINQKYLWSIHTFGPYPEGKAFENELQHLLEEGLIDHVDEYSQDYAKPVNITKMGFERLNQIETKYDLTNEKNSITEILNDFKHYGAKDMELRSTLIFLHVTNLNWDYDQLVNGFKEKKAGKFKDFEIERAIEELMKLKYIKADI